MWDESGSISGPDLKLGPEYKKLIDDYIAEQKDKMAKRVRCSFCQTAVKTVIILGEEALERHVFDPHGAGEGRACVGSGYPVKTIETMNKIHSKWTKKPTNVIGSELDMPRNIAEDHKAFRDVIGSGTPVALKLKEKIKDGSIFHGGYVHRVPKNKESQKCPICNEPYGDNLDCYYGDCAPKKTYKPIKCSVEILEG